MNTKYSFLILPGKKVPSGLEGAYKSAFETFRNVWSETFKEVGSPTREIFSNDFTRQDYIQALFFDEKCVALDFLRVIDLKNPVDHEDSWFRNWDKRHLIKLATDGFDVCLVNSYFTVLKEFRKTIQGEAYPVSYLLGCLSVLHQLELKVPLMFGTMRNNRSMDKLAKLYGSITLEQNVLQNNIPSDLVAFTLKNIAIALKDFPEVVFDIFNQKTDYFERQKIYEKTA